MSKELLMKILPSLALVAALCAPAFGQRRRAAGAPEIDPGLAAAGVSVLVGGTLWLTGRRRKPTQ
jgi:LPXTG-motif cell wall-anchored protein